MWLGGHMFSPKWLEFNLVQSTCLELVSQRIRRRQRWRQHTTLRTHPFNVLIETLPHACFLCAVFFFILVSAVIVSKYGQRQVLSSPIQSDSLTPFGQTIPRNAMQQQSAAAFFDCHLSSARLRLRFPSRNDSIEG